MKHLSFAFLLATVCTQSFAGVPGSSIGSSIVKGKPEIGGVPTPVENLYAANYYICQGKNLTVHYAIGGFASSDDHTLSISKKNGQSFNINATVNKTLVGTLVSGYDENLMDATRSFALNLPEVLLSASVANVDFDALFIENFNGASPEVSARPGLQDSISYTPVKCNAKSVKF